MPSAPAEKPAAPRPAAPPTIDWPEFFSSVKPGGVEFSEKMRELEGRRVRLRGYSLAEPRPSGGLFLTRLPAGRLHPDDFDTLPWDAIGVVWRTGLRLPPVPQRPTIEGTLRLGNRKLEDENVIILVEDAVPVLPAGTAKSSAGQRRWQTQGPFSRDLRALKPSLAPGD